MKLKVNSFTDELRFKVVHDYISSDLSQRELMEKYKIRGVNTIKKWMRKFDMQEPSQNQIELQRTMAKQKEKTLYEHELESKVKKLEQQLSNEQLRTLALDTMIDIAERDLKISIRKKSGVKR
jgi:transposase-like protein